MFQHSVTRSHAGVIIDGAQITLHLYPNDDGRVGVDLIVMPIITGFDRPCSVLSSGRTLAFLPGEIDISDNSIVCQAANAYFPSLKEGFACPLEPGMAPLLRRWLPRLDLVAMHAGKLCDLAHAQLIAMTPPVHIRHTYGAFPTVVAGIVLDGLTAFRAIELLRHDALYGSEPAMFAVLASEPVQALLAQAQQDAAKCALQAA